MVKECIELKKYPLKLIWFQDDEMLTNPYLCELLDLYKKEVNVPFHCQIRIEFLTEDIVKKLKDSGCVSVTFAVESGNEYMRKRLLYKNISDNEIIRGSEILNRIGLKFRTESMCGLPGESLNQMFETLDLNKKCKSTYAWVSMFQPYPSLPLAEYARKNKFWDGSISNIKETFFEDTILNTTIKKEIVSFQRLFSIFSFFKVSVWLVRFLISFPNNWVYDCLFRKFKQWRYKVLYGC
jgi:radical SAM superfamily enzyme YgiQ (UPF0313 family)